MEFRFSDYSFPYRDIFGPRRRRENKSFCRIHPLLRTYFFRKVGLKINSIKFDRWNEDLGRLCDGSGASGRLLQEQRPWLRRRRRSRGQRLYSKSNVVYGNLSLTLSRLQSRGPEVGDSIQRETRVWEPKPHLMSTPESIPTHVPCPWATLWHSRTGVKTGTWAIQYKPQRVLQVYRHTLRQVGKL